MLELAIDCARQQILNDYDIDGAITTLQQEDFVDIKKAITLLLNDFPLKKELEEDINGYVEKYNNFPIIAPSYIKIPIYKVVDYYINHTDPFYGASIDDFIDNVIQLKKDEEILLKIEKCWYVLFDENSQIIQNTLNKIRKKLSVFIPSYESDIDNLTYKDAGWISKSGEYIGENGTSASLIHSRLERIIQKVRGYDSSLEHLGWCKQHYNKIYVIPSKSKNIPCLSKSQIKAIVELLKHKYSVVEFPIQNKFISIERLKNTNNVWEIQAELEK